MNQGWLYRDQVGPADAGITLLAYYAQRYRHSSQQDWQERIEQGQVLVDGQMASVEWRLHPGQQLTYCRPPWQELSVPLDFTVWYEDADVLVVNKPAGLPVLPGGGFLEHTLLRQLQQRYPQDTPVPIHRLGRGTSGLMLLARSPLARAHLSQQMRQGHIRKIYRALVANGPIPDPFSIQQPIGKLPYPGLGYLYGATPTGRFAHSQGRVLNRTATTALLEVEIFTGRPHQIRIHLAALGHPLLGDPLYPIGGIPCPYPVDAGQKEPVPGDCGYYLHAYQLTFTHPQTHEERIVTCPVPTDWSPLLSHIN
ncbi:MAG: RluA family pseudouridine synthase [Thermosynechococcaceae cyanobacterium]